MKLILILALLALCAGCAPNRVLVDSRTCQREPGLPGIDNCIKIRDL